MSSIPRILEAVEFTVKAHGFQSRSIGPVEIYVAHCIRVAKTVTEIGADEDTIIAALLHDTVEDTSTSIYDIKFHFGNRVAELVAALTDERATKGRNRQARKESDRARLADAPAEAQTIKCADLIDNTASIVEHDPGFAKVYLEEKKKTLEIMRKADRCLWEEAMQMVIDSQLKLELKEITNAGC